MQSMTKSLAICLLALAACSNDGAGDGNKKDAIGTSGSTGGQATAEPTSTTPSASMSVPPPDGATDAGPQPGEETVLPPGPDYCPFWRPDGTCGWPTPDDQDGDGYPASVDCNDQVPTVNPGAYDIPCDNVDDDCDGADYCPVDRDQDGFDESVDCNDYDYNIKPSGVEIRCNGLDEDCDAADMCDADGDGFVASYPLPLAYEATISFNYPDCDDTDATVYGGAPEVFCDGKDQDCDGFDCCDNDNDGDGSPCKLDCNDNDPSMYPGASIPAGFCGNKDLNCDGQKDGICRL